MDDGELLRVSTVHRLAMVLALFSAVTSLAEEMADELVYGVIARAVACTSLAEEMVADELVYGVIARAVACSPLLLDPMRAVERCAAWLWA